MMERIRQLSHWAGLAERREGSRALALYRLKSGAELPSRPLKCGGRRAQPGQVAKNLHKTISSEIAQSSETRRRYFKPIEKQFAGRTLLTFFTSFDYPVDITDDDCDMLQSILQNVDVSSGLILMISSPGGDGLAAERIVNTCRAYSGTGDYWALVPGKAKSAATIITMGATKIFMGPSSELGPVDPQIFKVENGIRKSFSAHNLVQGYDKLFRDATNAAGPLEPYLQQLANYDDREINHYRSLITLSGSISVKVLHTGMLSGKSDAEIKKDIEVFLNPTAGTLAHGRPIYADEARECGLVIETLDVNSENWRRIYELYARTEQFVSMQVCKAAETRQESFYVAIQQAQ